MVLNFQNETKPQGHKGQLLVELQKLMPVMENGTRFIIGPRYDGVWRYAIWF